jgi:hypothetical protein
MSEPLITVNGHILSDGQAMTVRVALEHLASQMRQIGLGDDDHGRAMAKGYCDRVAEIRGKIMPEPTDETLCIAVDAFWHCSANQRAGIGDNDIDVKEGVRAALAAAQKPKMKTDATREAVFAELVAALENLLNTPTAGCAELSFAYDAAEERARAILAKARDC